MLRGADRQHIRRFQTLDHDITVSVHVVPLAQFRRYADFLPFYQNVLKEGIRYAS